VGEAAGDPPVGRSAAFTVVLIVGFLLLTSCATDATDVSGARVASASSPAATRSSPVDTRSSPGDTSGAVPSSAGTSSTSPGANGTVTTIPVPAADVAAIETVLEAVNATAGGPVAAQRVALQRWVVQGEAKQQRDCPAAHNTLRLDAVYDDLRRTPGEPSTAPSTTSGPGHTEYLLPVLITIFTGDRITGTDLTTLRLFVTKGTARIGHLCVS
jgi:hypothetical protein